jgi:hypothetical protein
MRRSRRFLLSNQSRFSPASIPDLALWLDASDASTLTLDGSNNVEQWRDKSGNARHAAQASTTLRPAFLSSGINGLPAVRGDGIDDVMTWTQFASGTNHNFYIVGAYNTSGTYNQFGGFFGTAPSSGGRGHSIFFPDASGVANPKVSSRQDGTSPDYEFIAAGNAVNVRSGSPAVFSLLRNGGNYAAKWTHAAKVSWTRTGTYATSATTSNRIFASHFGSFPFIIAELLCFTRDLTAGEEAQLSAHFASRYGVGI